LSAWPGLVCEKRFIPLAAVLTGYALSRDPREALGTKPSPTLNAGLQGALLHDIIRRPSQSLQLSYQTASTPLKSLKQGVYLFQLFDDRITLGSHN
jgi:hypothetical protein